MLLQAWNGRCCLLLCRPSRPWTLWSPVGGSTIAATATLSQSRSLSCRATLPPASAGLRMPSAVHCDETVC